MKKLFAVWVIVLLVGLGVLLRFSLTAGEPARAAKRWPAAASIARDSRLATLLLFVHPDCPCSAASRAELSRLLPSIRERAKVEIISDRALAARFGVRTSGQVLLYSASGELVFSGGITPERGHQGDSAGRAIILDYFAGNSATIAQATPVFGCAMDDAEGG